MHAFAAVKKKIAHGRLHTAREFTAPTAGRARMASLCSPGALNAESYQQLCSAAPGPMASARRAARQGRTILSLITTVAYHPHCTLSPLDA
jgi:hypothetical protein